MRTRVAGPLVLEGKLGTGAELVFWNVLKGVGAENCRARCVVGMDAILTGLSL